MWSYRIQRFTSPPFPTLEGCLCAIPGNRQEGEQCFLICGERELEISGSSLDLAALGEMLTPTTPSGEITTITVTHPYGKQLIWWFCAGQRAFFVKRNEEWEVWVDGTLAGLGMGDVPPWIKDSTVYVVGDAKNFGNYASIVVDRPQS